MKQIFWKVFYEPSWTWAGIYSRYSEIAQIRLVSSGLNLLFFHFILSLILECHIEKTILKSSGFKIVELSRFKKIYCDARISFGCLRNVQCFEQAIVHQKFSLSNSCHFPLWRNSVNIFSMFAIKGSRARLS